MIGAITWKDIDWGWILVYVFKTMPQQLVCKRYGLYDGTSCCCPWFSTERVFVFRTVFDSISRCHKNTIHSFLTQIPLYKTQPFLAKPGAERSEDRKTGEPRKLKSAPQKGSQMRISTSLIRFSKFSTVPFKKQSCIVTQGNIRKATYSLNTLLCIPTLNIRQVSTHHFGHQVPTSSFAGL